MAQAARLNLRMQKELKLLLTDPPPGVSFPLLSSDSDASSSSSLSTIHAQIEGLEGTVYEKGVFKIMIQIPERYPFQPPSVTFATPIYHPNIDNGGRICLDILNLPPKGAWQPSLNISTVLTSIGLLLSEPNPDDALMCEVSREYKYNRQTFDQKARSMTEKYAKNGTCGSIHSSQYIQTNSNPSMMEGEKIDKSKQEDEVNEYCGSSKKLCLISRKLSLDSSVSTEKINDKDLNYESPHHLVSNTGKQMEVQGAKQSNGMLVEHYSSQEKPCGTRQKSSLESSGQFPLTEGNDKANASKSHRALLLNPGNVYKASSGLSLMKSGDYNKQHLRPNEDGNNKEHTGSSDACEMSNETNEKLCYYQSISDTLQGTSPVPHALNDQELHHHKDLMDRKENASTNTRCMKTGSVGKKLTLGLKRSSQRLEKCDKENVMPIHKVPLSNSESPINHVTRRRLSLGPLMTLQGNNGHSHFSTDPSKPLLMQEPCKPEERQLPNQHFNGNTTREEERQAKQESPIPETVIVLDSEDSEEEGNESTRSKFPLARKRLGRWKAKI